MPCVVVEPRAISRLAPVCVRCATRDAQRRVAIGLGSSLPLPFAFGTITLPLCAPCERTVKVKRAAERAASFLLALVVLALVGLRFRPLLVPALLVLGVLPSVFARRFERAVIGVTAKRRLFDDRVELRLESPAVIDAWKP